MKRLLLIAFSIALPTAVIRLAGQVNSTPPASAERPTIEGVVVDDISGEPIADVSLSWRPPIPPEARGSGPRGAPAVVRAFTDSKGRFAFPNVTPGSNRILAHMTGYVDEVYSFDLKPGQKLNNATLRLVHSAVISGRVVDLRGRPLVDASVTLYEQTYTLAGERTLTAID